LHGSSIALAMGSGRREDHTERAFHVVELELNFVMDYYHSVVPVVLCSPWFLVGNYLFVFLE
ncbi:DUF4220 domain-containing protein, partial [Escherichia coli]|uniref:DUF4220 domain-containing protein n=1 Tax=Escherichia coli TaxID=562 RepID=UPI0013D2AF28